MLRLIWIAAISSVGDRDPAYRACVSACTRPEACEAWQATPLLDFNGWSCSADCAYHCMWRITSIRQAQGQTVLQYHGKWPFARLFGMQEPVAAMASLVNGLVHLAGLLRCWQLMSAVPSGWLWRVFGLLSVNAWLWALVFHCRDVYWTQCADYFSATLLVGGAALVAAHHLAETYGRAAGRASSATVVALALAAYGEHVRRMLRHFDYGAHLRLNVALGAVHQLLWLLWWWRARATRPHA